MSDIEKEYLLDQKLLDNIVVEIQKNVVGETDAIKTIILVIVLLKVKNKSPASSNLCINAPSGTGKDYLVDSCLEILPKENLLRYRRSSPKALDYELASKLDNNCDSKLVYLEDANYQVINSESIKTLMTAKHGHTTTVTIASNGSAINLDVVGKPGFIFTSATAGLKPELLRRVSYLKIDASLEQTIKITKKQAKHAKTNISESFSEKSKSFYLGLEEVEVIIPFAEDVQVGLSKFYINNKNHVIFRTIFERFLDYIKASACLYQYQRKKDECNRVIAEEIDYANARIMLKKTTNNALMIPLSNDQLELLRTISNNNLSSGTVEIISMRFTKWQDRWLRKQLDDLVEMGFLTKKEMFQEHSDKPIGVYSADLSLLEFEIPTYAELNTESNCSNCTVSSTIEVNSSSNAPPEFTVHNTNTTNAIQSDLAEAKEEVVLA